MKRKNELYSKIFIILTAISVASILISNICSVKLFSLGNIILPSSALLFPITYILGDVFAEVYGFKKARFVILLGFFCNAFMVLFFQLAIILPAAETWGLQECFQSILGTTPRMFIASLCAFLVGSLSNAYVMSFIKKITKGKFLWVRTIGSTVIGELFDTLIFVLMAFVGSVPKEAIITMIICQLVWKVSYEIIATPLTYLVINKFKKLENIE